MRVVIDEDLGSGCGSCTEMCPEVFGVDDDPRCLLSGEGAVSEHCEEACRDATCSGPVELSVSKHENEGCQERWSKRMKAIEMCEEVMSKQDTGNKRWRFGYATDCNTCHVHRNAVEFYESHIY